MSGGNQLIGVSKRLRNGRPQAGVWAISIVVGHPFTKSPPEMGDPRQNSSELILASQYTLTITREINTAVKSTQIETAKGGKVLLTPWMR